MFGQAVTDAVRTAAARQIADSRISVSLMARSQRFLEDIAYAPSTNPD
jgi:hypothetical protein